MTCLRFSSQLCRLPLWPKSKHYSFIKKLSSVTTSTFTAPNHLTSNALTCQVSDLSSVLVKRAHLQASHLMRRQFVTSCSNNLVTKDSTAFSKRSLAGRGTTWLASRRSKSDTSASTVKDSELKAKVKATVESPAGADEQFYDRNFVTAVRAMSEFLLKPEHLVRLSITVASYQNESFSCEHSLLSPSFITQGRMGPGRQLSF